MYLFVFLMFALDGEIVLRNNKVIPYQGTYEVVGNTVRFTSKKGKPMQLPLKIVDLNKTKVRQKALEDEGEAEKQRAAAAKPAKKERPKSMVDLLEDDGIRTDVAIGGKDVAGYTHEAESDRSYGQSSNSGFGSNGYYIGNDSNLSPEQNELRKEFLAKYYKLDRERNGHRNKIWRVQAEIRDLERKMPEVASDDALDAQNKVKLVSLGKDIEELQENILKIDRKVTRLKKEAKAAGLELDMY